MGLIVSTTGTDVSLPELGITITHPTSDRDLSGQFSADEIGRCDSLTTAIRAGTLTWKKLVGGPVQPPTDYDSDFLDIDAENTGPGLKNDRVVTFKDLAISATPTKSGTIAPAGFTGAPRKATVTFATPFSLGVGENYAVIITGADSRAWTIESKTAAGFVINANASAALSGNVDWAALKTGETA